MTDARQLNRQRHRH